MENERIYVIDAGNSALKVATFVSNELLEIQRFPSDSIDSLRDFVNKNTGKYVLSSVLSETDNAKIRGFIPDLLEVDFQSELSLKVNYGTLNTLGVDRLCNAVYVFNRIDSEYGLVVDIGTCIKFDLVHRTKGYLGGSISPGITIRYKSLNDYTGKLPLLSNKSRVDYVGTDTQTSIRSGVMNGIEAELNEMMKGYSERYPSLTFFVTGGDAKNFDILSKNDIFADENLTLIGLYEIYKQNA